MVLPTTEASNAPATRGSPWAALLRTDPSRYVVYVGFLLILAIFAVVLRDDGFLSPTNLTNIDRRQGSRVAELHATARLLGEARLETRARFDPLSHFGDFSYELQVRDIDLTRANDLARAYAGLDFAGGRGDFTMALEARDGQLTGYAKPLFRGLKIFSWKQDVASGDKNPLQIAWQALAQGVTSLFKNHAEDQFATRVPISGRIDDRHLDTVAAILGVLRNAFVKAYTPKLEHLPSPPGH